MRLSHGRQLVRLGLHVQNFYSDTLLGLATPKQLALAARASGLALTQAEARDFIRKQAVTQRFRPIARKRGCSCP
jgi:hypothetical protein